MAYSDINVHSVAYRRHRKKLAMDKLTDFTSFADAQGRHSTPRLWELFDGNRERLNIAHE